MQRPAQDPEQNDARAGDRPLGLVVDEVDFGAPPAEHTGEREAADPPADDQDAVVLDEMLAEGGDVEATLRAFVDRRFERCKLVVEQSVARTRGIIDPTPDFDVAAFERRVWGELAKPF